MLYEVITRTFTLGIIVNELLTNALKYAFDGRRDGSVRLDVCVYDESVIMTMRDDGKGLPDRFDIAESSGLGLSLISMLLEQFDGTLTMRTDHGTVSTALIKAPGLEATARITSYNVCYTKLLRKAKAGCRSL